MFGMMPMRASKVPEISIDWWNTVVLAMHMDGANNSTVFTDEKGHTFTAYGDAKIVTDAAAFGGSQALFSAVGDYISTPDSTDFNMRDGPFCISCFVTFNTIDSNLQTVVSKASLASAEAYEWALMVSEGYLFLYRGVRGSSQGGLRILFPTTLTAGVRYNLVLQRDASGTFKGWLNGALCTQYQYAGQGVSLVFGGVTNGYWNEPIDFGNNSAPLTVGAFISTYNPLLGKVDDLLMMLSAPYSGNFLPRADAFPNE